MHWHHRWADGVSIKTLSTWGWYRQCGVDPRIRDTAHGGTYLPCADPQLTDGTQHLVKFGNDFVPGAWREPNTVPHSNWHHWDNPEFPHLLYPNPANPSGGKHFIRWVRGEIMTTQSDTPGEQAINSVLQDLSKGVLHTWRDIYAPRVDTRPQTKRVLLVTSTPNCHKWYYGETITDWIQRVTAQLNHMGYTDIHIRSKEGRSTRRENEHRRLYHQLEQMRYDFIVNQHSASTVEALLTGCAVVSTGRHCGGDLITTWDQFTQGATPRSPHPTDVEAWMQHILGNCRFKAHLQ